jgi:hypothetical protein
MFCVDWSTIKLNSNKIMGLPMYSFKNFLIENNSTREQELADAERLIRKIGLGRDSFSAYRGLQYILDKYGLHNSELGIRVADAVCELSDTEQVEYLRHSLSMLKDTGNTWPRLQMAVSNLLSRWIKRNEGRKRRSFFNEDDDYYRLASQFLQYAKKVNPTMENIAMDRFQRIAAITGNNWREF